MSPQPIELIVVVDGEDDGSGKVAKNLGAKVLHLSKRSGPAAARNAGAQVAKGEILLFIDADVIPSQQLVEQVADVFDSKQELAAIIGSYDNKPGEVHFLSQYRNLLHHFVHQNSDEQAHTFWGACGAIRKEVFKATGGFDENIDTPAMEDVELGYRLRRAGHRIGLFKHIQVKHLKRWDVLTMLRTDIFQRAIPWTRLLLREDTLHNDLNLRTESRYSAVIAWILVGTICLAWYQPQLLYLTAMAGLSLLVLNAPLYTFFRHERGIFFALQTIPWHWLYFLYSSASFAYVVLTEGTRQNRT